MIELTTTNWDIFASRNNPLLIVFYTEMCQNCKPLIRKLEIIESEYPDVIFCKCNAFGNYAIVNRFHVKAVPSVLLIDGLTPKAFLPDFDNVKKGLSEYKERKR